LEDNLDLPKEDRIIIVGTGHTAENVCAYVRKDTQHKVVAFSTEQDYITSKDFLGLPIVPFESLEQYYPPSQHKAIVAISYTKLNRMRTRLYEETKRKGFDFISYVNSKAMVFEDVEIGENCMIFEGVILQRKVSVGNNVYISPGVEIGHESRIGNNCYIAPHVALHGEIGDNCFLGTNCCMRENIKVAKDCVIGAGAVVLKDTEPGKIYVGNPARPLPKTSYERFDVK
jgi:sugar O-acyltransferase (sialic acid O-acetyltransferase NeuD family)